jgi:hypothetical protein
MTETEYLVYHEALQNRAPSNQVVQRALRDLNKYKCELLKLGELKPLENAVGEVAVFDGGNAQGRGDAVNGFRQHRQPRKDVKVRFET